MRRIRVSRGENDAGHFLAQDQVRAGRRSSLGGTGLETDIKRRPFDLVSAAFRRANGMDLGVRSARCLVIPFANDFSTAHQDRSDTRIWKRQSAAARRQFDRALEEAPISAQKSS